MVIYSAYHNKTLHIFCYYFSVTKCKNILFQKYIDFSILDILKMSISRNQIYFSKKGSKFGFCCIMQRIPKKERKKR